MLNSNNQSSIVYAYLSERNPEVNRQYLFCMLMGESHILKVLIRYLDIISLTKLMQTCQRYHQQGIVEKETALRIMNSQLGVE